MEKKKPGRPRKTPLKTSTKEVADLTAKQEAYCQAFVVTNDKSASYRIAYDADEMNINTVNTKAWELHRNGAVTARIAVLFEEVRERNKVKIDEVLGTLADMLRFDVAEIFDENDNLKPIREIPKHHRQMISSIKKYEEFQGGGVTRDLVGYTKEIKLLNKLDVIEKFMKHLGAYEKDNKQKASVFDLASLDEKKSRIAELLAKK